MKFSRNTESGRMEAYTDDGVFVGRMVTMGDLISNRMANDGGPGSGNHGHAGRPGEVGGSAPGKGSAKEETESALRKKALELSEQLKGLSRFGEEGEKREEIVKQIHEIEEKFEKKRKLADLRDREERFNHLIERMPRSVFKKARENIRKQINELENGEEEKDKPTEESNKTIEEIEKEISEKETDRAEAEAAAHMLSDELRDAGEKMMKAKRGDDQEEIDKCVAEYVDIGFAHGLAANIANEARQDLRKLNDRKSLLAISGKQEEREKRESEEPETLEDIEDLIGIKEQDREDIKHEMRLLSGEIRDLEEKVKRLQIEGEDDLAEEAEEEYYKRKGEYDYARQELAGVELEIIHLNEKKGEALSVKEKEEIEKSGMSEPDYRREKAKEIFGITDNYNECGWILPSGEMLNFGDKDNPTGERENDHREISRVYPMKTGSGSSEMRRFRNDGNVRMYPEIPGVNIAVTGKDLTDEQYQALEEIIDAINDEGRGQFCVDFSTSAGDMYGQLAYTTNPHYGDDYTQYTGDYIDASEVIRDIKDHLNTGEITEEFGSATFHGDSMPEKLAKDGGEGSGNFNHAGRPGEVGGSAPSGSSGGGEPKPDTQESSSSIKKSLAPPEEDINLARRRISEASMSEQFMFFANYMRGIKYGEGKGHEAMQSYNYHGDVLMNNLLRSGKPLNFDQQKEWKKNINTTKQQIDDLTDVINGNEIRRPAVVFRGISTFGGLAKMLGIEYKNEAGMQELLSDPDFAKSLIGQTFSDPAFTSTTIDPTVLRRTGFDKACKMEVFLPKGTKGVYFGDQARITDEHEFLLQRGTQFVITEANVEEGWLGTKRLILKVSVVDQAPKEVPEKYVDAFPEARPEIEKAIKNGKVFEQSQLQRLFPEADPDVLEELNQIKQNEKRTADITYRIWELLTIQNEVGSLSDVEACELEGYAMNNNDRLNPSSYTRNRKEINGRISDFKERENDPKVRSLREEVVSKYPDRDEKTTLHLMAHMSELHRLEDRVERDIEQYGDGPIVKGLRRTIEEEKRSMKYIARNGIRER